MSKRTGLPKFVWERKTRHGRLVYYFNRTRKPPYHRLPDYGTPEFHLRYYELLASSDVTEKAARARAVVHRTQPNTWGWAIPRFLIYRKAKLAGKHLSGVGKDERILDAMSAEPLSATDARLFADFPLGQLTRKDLQVLVNRKAEIGQGRAALDRYKVLRRFGEWMAREDLVNGNPAAGLDKPAHKDKQHRPWTSADIDAYEAKHEVGSKARMALAILLGTGAARADVVKLGPGNLHNGVVRYIRQKSGEECNIPAPGWMTEAINTYWAAQKPGLGSTTWLTTEYWKPFTPGGFGNRLARWCKQAGVPSRAHGARVAAAIRDAERGATANELLCRYGWMDIRMAERYTKQADRRRIGAASARLDLVNKGGANEG